MKTDCATHCAKHLSKYKRPLVFERCIGDLPRNFLGKVIRRELRDSDTTLATVSDEPMEVK